MSKSKKGSKPINFRFWWKILLGLVFIGLVFIAWLRFFHAPAVVSLTEHFDPSETVGVFHNQVVSVPTELVAESESTAPVLGDTSVEKRIEVDLSTQRLYLFEGDQLIDHFLISSGKWGRTPTGEFTIWSKFRYTKMSGGSRALNTYYYLPNVPYVMFFANNEIAASRGFSIHGTYWHENFGHPMSHGCINMKTEEAEKVYHWAHPTLADGARSGRSSKDNPGTRVIIYGEAPKE